MPKRMFVAYHSDGVTGGGDFVFNEDTQDVLFPSIEAAKQGVEDMLNEPEAEDCETGEIITYRDEYGDSSEFVIYELTPVAKIKP